MENVLVGCDWKMLKHVAGITWRDGVSGEEVLRCGLYELSLVPRLRGLKWFEHMERREGGETLGRVVGLEVPKKTFRQCVEENLELGIEEAETKDRESQNHIIYCLTS